VQREEQLSKNFTHSRYKLQTDRVQREEQLSKNCTQSRYKLQTDRVQREEQLSTNCKQICKFKLSDFCPDFVGFFPRDIFEALEKKNL
jgi:hypothetical protein